MKTLRTIVVATALLTTVSVSGSDWVAPSDTVTAAGDWVRPLRTIRLIWVVRRASSVARMSAPVGALASKSRRTTPRIR
mgnify:CR=1 FL=1